jgi:2-keto-4-pentenoate hydratase
VAANEIHPRIVAAQRRLFDTWRRALSDGSARRVGWKVGHAIPEIQALTGDQPVVGYLTTNTLLHDNETYHCRHPEALRAETELVIQLGGDVDAAADDQELQHAIAATAVGLELVDVGRPPREVDDIVAANVFHRAVVFGRHRAPPAGGLGSAMLTVNGRIHHADEHYRDPVKIIRDVARIVQACGERLIAGDRILAGSVVHVPVQPGDHVTAHIHELGHASAYIAT